MKKLAAVLANFAMVATATCALTGMIGVRTGVIAGRPAAAAPGAARPPRAPAPRRRAARSP
ncbi:MAG: hypothetical protein FWB79_05730, partial [Treponema sp.]|nr:hypothetical protein [Treponema sp.]